MYVVNDWHELGPQEIRHRNVAQLAARASPSWESLILPTLKDCREGVIQHSRSDLEQQMSTASGPAHGNGRLISTDVMVKLVQGSG